MFNEGERQRERENVHRLPPVPAEPPVRQGDVEGAGLMAATPGLEFQRHLFYPRVFTSMPQFPHLQNEGMPVST